MSEAQPIDPSDRQLPEAVLLFMRLESVYQDLGTQLIKDMQEIPIKENRAEDDKWPYDVFTEQEILEAIESGEICLWTRHSKKEHATLNAPVQGRTSFSPSWLYHQEGFLVWDGYLRGAEEFPQAYVTHDIPGFVHDFPATSISGQQDREHCGIVASAEYPPFVVSQRDLFAARRVKRGRHTPYKPHPYPLVSDYLAVLSERDKSPHFLTDEECASIVQNLRADLVLDASNTLMSHNTGLGHNLATGSGLLK